MDKQFLYFAVMILGSIAVRTDVVRNTGGFGLSLIPMNHFKSVLGILSAIAFTSITIWGFINLKWYIALVSFIGISLIFGLAVNRGTLGTLVMVKPIIDVIIIALAALIWIF